MRLLLALVAIAACNSKQSAPEKEAISRKDPWDVPSGSATIPVADRHRDVSAPIPTWIHDPPAVLRGKILAVNAHVIVLKSIVGFAEYREVLAHAERTPGVVAAEPFIFTELMIAKSGKPPVGIACKAVDPNRVGRVLGLGPHMKAGSLDSLGTKSNPAPIVIGDDLARKLDARVGDTVVVTSHDDAPSGVPPIKPTEFRITGLFHIDFDEYDERLALVPLSTMQTMLGRGDQVMGIEMTVKDLAGSAEIAKAIEQALGGPPYQALDWYELNTQLFHAMYGDRRP